MGVGNDLNGDDGAGLLVCDKMEKMEGVKTAITFTAPENFVDDAIAFKPDRVVLIDAADWGGFAGEVCELSMDTIQKAHFSTHRAPLKIIRDRLAKKKILFSVVGIQAKTIGLGEQMSKEVRKACLLLAENILAFRSVR